MLKLRCIPRSTASWGYLRATSSPLIASDILQAREKAGLQLSAGFPHQNARQVRMSSSYVEKEADNFRKLADKWWDKRGIFGALHAMNDVRAPWLIQNAAELRKLDPNVRQPLHGLRVLDVGCGGGIMTERLAKEGATVTGIDMVPESLEAARQHAKLVPQIQELISYRNESAENLASQGEIFDLVVASEVIEHVANPRAFCATLASLTAPGGGLLVTTINRTPQSYILAIVMAEQVLGIVPRGTHEWQKFVKPEEVTLMVQEQGMALEGVTGTWYNPLIGSWSYVKDLGVNYMAFFAKPRTSSVT